MWADLHSVIIEASIVYIYTPVPNPRLSGDASIQRLHGTVTHSGGVFQAPNAPAFSPPLLPPLPPNPPPPPLSFLSAMFLRRRLLRVLREASDLCARGCAGSRRSSPSEPEIISGTFHIGKRWWGRQTKQIDYFCLVWTASGTVCFILQRSHFQSKSPEHIKEKRRKMGSINN